MRKAMKRKLGREKQVKNLADSIESGLAAQGRGKAQREREHQQALIERDARSKKRKTTQESDVKVMERVIEDSSDKSDLKRASDKDLVIDLLEVLFAEPSKESH